MKSTDFRKFNYRTMLGRLNGSRLGGFGERQVSARTQVTIEIGFEKITISSRHSRRMEPTNFRRKRSRVVAEIRK